MKIRCWSKPGIYLIVLHNNSDKEPTTAIVCFRFSGRLKSQHALKVSRTSWGYTVVELKHITKKSTNQSRVNVREPKCDWPSKDKGLSHDSRAFFNFVPKAITSLAHWRNESLIKAFVPSREFCNFIGLKFLLRRQGFIRSKRSRNEFEFCDDAITQFEHSRFFTSLFLFCLHARQTRQQI